MEFERLLDQYRHELIAYCRHLLWKKDELDDAVQEVVLQAYRAYARYTEGDFKRWLFQVTTNTVSNLNRKHSDRPLGTVESERAVEVQLGLEESYQAILKDPTRVPAEIEGPLRGGLEQLSDTERAVFLLRSIGEFKYREIAEMLCVPIGTVMGSLSRARAKLRERLAERVHAL